MVNLTKMQVRELFDEIVPAMNERNPFMDYLYRYRHGDKLPRGRNFDKLRVIENMQAWSKVVEDSQFQILQSQYRSIVSPYLLSQLTLLACATTHGYCELNTGVVFDTIRMLEDGCGYAESTMLQKHAISFRGSGVLAEYTHHHAPMLPSAYLEMCRKCVRDRTLHCSQRLRRTILCLFN